MITILGYQITFFQVIATVFGVGLLIFVHELGHFLMAKKFKIKVEQFSFGFGPEIVGFTYGETRYSICAIPLGGMVKMPGEYADSATGSPNEFLSQPWYRRLTIAVLGPLMNYVLAIAFFSFVVFHWGVSTPSMEPIIGDVIADFPAAQAGLQKGDKITKIDSLAVSSWQELAEYVHKRPNQKLSLAVTREGKEIALEIIPKKEPSSGMGMIGISPLLFNEKVGLISSIGYGARMTVFQSYFTLKYLGEKIVRWEKPELSGPIGVIQVLAKAAKTGWENLLYLLGVISTALGLFNLLPIPLLDGGHIFIAIIEGIIRKPLNKRLIQTANIVGFGIIISIFLFATYSDLARTGIIR